MTIIREYTSLDTENRKRVFVEVSCEVCSLSFTRQKRQLRTHICGQQCKSILAGTSVKLSCAHCSIVFVKPKAKLAGSKSGKYFCTRVCKDTAQTYMPEIRPAHYSNGEYSYREKAFRHYKPVCALCSFNNLLALEVHHIDKDRLNNDISNLIILCANCHTLEHRK